MKEVASDFRCYFREMNETRYQNTGEEGYNMKKRVSRYIVLIAAICSLMLFPAITGYAADGTLMLSDPTGNVGGEITVTVRADAAGQPIGDANITLSYDTAMLEFVSGTNAQGGEGTVTLSGSGTGTETELAFELTFKGLAEGTAAIQVTESTAYLFSDETLNLSAGEAAVTIEPGDGTAAPSESESTERILGQESIDIDGVYYAIYENFTDALIPAGFSRSTVQYAGVEHSAIRQDLSGKVFLLMISGEEDPIMVLYNESDSTFVRAEQVDVSDSFYIFVLSAADGSSLPEQFSATSLSLHGVNFPAWQNMDAMDYYLVYALSSTGVEGYYQYDVVDQTYQRYVAPAETIEPEEEEEDDSTLGKVQKIITENLLILAGAVVVIVFILFIIILVLSIKLGHRNAELEDMYVGDGEDKPNVKKKSRQQFVGYDDEEDEDDDDFLEDDFDNSEYDDDFDDQDDDFEDNFDDSDNDYDDDEYYDDDYDDDDDIKEYIPEKKAVSEKKGSYDDVDFIDV